MASLSEIRNKYPQYNDMSDQEFADKFYAKYYSDIPKEEYYKKVGFSPTSKEEKVEPESFLKKSGRYAGEFNKAVEGIPRTALELGAGAGQGLANVGAGVNRLLTKGLNTLPGVNLPMGPTVNMVPETPASEVGEFIGSIIGGGEVGKGIDALHYLDRIPHIANAVKKAGDIVGKLPTKAKNLLNIGGDISKNALVGAAMTPEDQGIGAALGGTGAAIGRGLGYVPTALEKAGILGTPGKNVTSYIKPEEIKETVEAGRRLGTEITPGEATRNPWVATQESRFKRTPKGSFENVQLGEQRAIKEKEAINSLLNNIFDKSDLSKNEIKNLYKSAERWNIKQDTLNRLKEDPLINDAIDKVKTSKAWQRNLKDVPENNIAFLDKVKRELNARERSLRRSEGGGGEAREYKLATKDLTNVLDSAPGYKEARQKAQREIVRGQIEKKLKKSQSEISGTDFYNNIIKNDIEFNKLYNKLGKVPEAQQQLKDMKAAWHSLINLPKSTHEAYKTESALNQARNTIMQYYEMAKDFLGISDSQKAIKYLRSNEWYDDLLKAKETGNKKKIEDTLSGIMGKLFPGGYVAISEKENK